MFEKFKNDSHPVLWILILNVLLFLFWNTFRYLIEPFLFGGYTIIKLFLMGVLFACVLFIFRSFWRKQNDSSRYILAGIVLLIFTSAYYSKLSTLNNLDIATPFYRMLADAFSIGQYHLIPLPSQELLSMADPYAPENVNVPGRIGDAVLYNGKYYLYFGPIPAIVLIMADWLFQTKFDNSFLIIFFLSLFAMMIFLIIYQIWRHKYPNIPWFVPLLCMVTILWSFPLLWLVGRPAVYESAIIGGQAFLFAGLYLLLVNFNNEKASAILLFGAGCAFGLSIGTRWNLIMPIFFLSLFVLILLLISSLDFRFKIQLAASFFLPLLFLVMVYGIYNYRRFGSPLESGYKYTLVGRGRNPVNPLSFVNIKNNLILYFLMPPADLSIKYPFITFAGVSDQVSDVYNVYGVTPDPERGYNFFANFCSVFWVAPLSITGLFTVLGLAKNLIGRLVISPFAFKNWLTNDIDVNLSFLALLFLASLLAMLLYAGTENRYHMDYFPSLGLLASIAFLNTFPLIQKSSLGYLIKTLLLLLISYSVVLGVIASITGRDQYFLRAAPEFVDFLNSFLSIFLKKIF